MHELESEDTPFYQYYKMNNNFRNESLQGEEKGLFTFYREQAEYDEEQRRLKKLKKLKKLHEMNHINEQPSPPQIKQNINKEKKVKSSPPPVIVARTKQQKPYFSSLNKDGYSLAFFNPEQQKLMTQRLDHKESGLGVIEGFHKEKTESAIYPESPQQLQIRYKKELRKRPSAFLNSIFRKSLNKAESNKEIEKSPKDEDADNHGIHRKSVLIFQEKNTTYKNKHEKLLPSIGKNQQRSSSELLSSSISPKNNKKDHRSGSNELLKKLQQNLKAEAMMMTGRDNIAYINYTSQPGQGEMQPDRLVNKLNQHQRRLFSILSTKKKE